MHLAIEHTTRYRFAEPVAYALQRLRLMPKETRGQKIIDWAVDYEGVVEELSYEDHNCNHVTLVSVAPDTADVMIRCRGTLLTEDYVGVHGAHSGHMPLWSFVTQTPSTAPGARMRALAATIREDRDTLDRLHDLSALILQQVVYEAGHTEVRTTAEEALETGPSFARGQAPVFDRAYGVGVYGHYGIV